MTNIDLLKLPEGEFKITNGNYHNLLIIERRKNKKGNHFLFKIKPQFGKETIWLEPKKSDFYTQSWVIISEFLYEGKIDLSKYIIEN